MGRRGERGRNGVVDVDRVDGTLGGMTKAKIAGTLPPDLVARARRAVRKGEVESVSAYVAAALEEKAKLEDLASMLDDMLEETGGPLSERERRAADHALGLQREGVARG
jgi:Arc/MetJ-type ribon-helix-helix transcriptional regulator